jgi:uncharacterized DUF497 family protein
MKPISSKPVVVWDDHKRAQNIRRHGVDLAEARLFKWETALVVESYRGAHGEQRYKGIGRIDERLMTVIFSVLGSEAISVISVRPASRRERRQHEDREETKDPSS